MAKKDKIQDEILIRDTQYFLEDLRILMDDSEPIPVEERERVVDMIDKVLEEF